MGGIVDGSGSRVVGTRVGEDVAGIVTGLVDGSEVGEYV